MEEVVGRHPPAFAASAGARTRGAFPSRVTLQPHVAVVAVRAHDFLFVFGGVVVVVDDPHRQATWHVLGAHIDLLAAAISGGATDLVAGTPVAAGAGRRRGDREYRATDSDQRRNQILVSTQHV